MAEQPSIELAISHRVVLGADGQPWIELTMAVQPAMANTIRLPAKHFVGFGEFAIAEITKATENAHRFASGLWIPGMPGGPNGHGPQPVPPISPGTADGST